VLQMASVIKILSSSKIQEMEKQPLRIDADMCGCLPEKKLACIAKKDDSIR